ncbi:MAG: aminomethyl-transferring glycine dehydrogenase [Chitinophagaceae bacterium]|nr:aminomethyl-transferring glycine dehydrogenase [Chitinophagaceae bacterium]
MNLFEKKQNEFAGRHIGPTPKETEEMLKISGFESIEALIDKTIPPAIRSKEDFQLPGPMSESDYLKDLKVKASKNKVFRSFIGQGYYGTLVPSVILRNLFENPGWYTQYTPYQAEISQGRLESLLNFQTMVSDLTGLPIANASLLDEGTAAAEAMTMLFNHKNRNTDHVTAPKLFVDVNVFTQTKNILHTRANPIGVELVFGDYKTTQLDDSYFAVLLQYPDSKGNINDYSSFISDTQNKGIHVIMAADILSLALLKSPGELGVDVAIGSTQRLGVPMGFGGPHAAYFATKDEFKRNIPGRIIGVSIDAKGNRALRMALQTREQHIRREKATSNICTAQALLANMAAMYAVFHGPEGIKEIALRIAILTRSLAQQLSAAGVKMVNSTYFDTLTIEVSNTDEIKKQSEAAGINFFYPGSNQVTISLDETAEYQDIIDIVNIFTKNSLTGEGIDLNNTETGIPKPLQRTSAYLLHPVFNSYHSETEMMRYLKKLENRDLSLTQSMISLGSCTMKLNAATELIPVSWPEFSNLHPFAPASQTEGYMEVIKELEDMLCTITGFTACSLQPNSGAQGEYAGLLTIRGYHESRGDHQRDVILIPISAHGTNPASAVMAGYKVVVTKCDDKGNIEVEDLKEKAEQYKDTLAGMMVTYPSTHGVFEESIKTICDIVHENGGMVYMDGANMNAQAGFTSPGLIGADVCHLNLHKTFAIPHGGGGPGVGPICVNDKLKPFLPTLNGPGQVSAAAYGSANILLISHGYIKMLGAAGLKSATSYAILNANYMKARLKEHFPILYTGLNDTCAHEFIVDLRPFKVSAGVEAEDVAKRLMDYGFHAPTLSFPVPGTIMIEPTESESKAELDRFCDALISIAGEIAEIEKGEYDKKENVLKNAPHSLAVVAADEWTLPYSRSKAAFPVEWLRQDKFWPYISRINNVYGDRNLICTCEPTEAYA